ncbi:recombinase [Flavobacterium subsaxonicum WB 4.1-42 = DSM 21790]|uniref:Recombinase n=1 Tax=Flavobacterium subsaxonicum WB 4.1-42 = DSM 21790 TaxID=1121898 RepID=A0A0A2MGM0_9FLAO|nr:recombinase [Flavobacterium subsaxonicum WB 4.1-42 = DSM 21790]
MTLPEFFATNFDEHNLWEYKADEVDLLAELVDIIRPKHPETAPPTDLTELLSLLSENERYRKGLSHYIKGLLSNKKFSKILTDAGILTDADFFFEVRKRLLAKILPDQPQKDTLGYVLNQVFFLSKDPVWLQTIAMPQLEKLFGLLQFRTLYDSGESNSPLAELIFSMEVLIHRFAGRALETAVIQMVPEYENRESPFLAIQKEFTILTERLLEEQRNYVSPSDIGYRQLLVLHHQCIDYVRAAFKNSEKYGISLRVNQSLLRIQQQLERLGVLLPLLAVDETGEATRDTIRLSLNLISYNCDKNNVRKLINESTQLISYEVTQHTANTGEHYITKDRWEYFRMFWNASGGGIIVGILCIIKVALSNIDTSAFGHAFYYSLNYSFGFIAIYVLGFTLATKQPAMTAAALVRALQTDRKNQEVKETEKHEAFAEFFARVFRSQFIAFVGNVILAFPVAWLGIWLIDIVFGYNLALTKWYHLVTDLSPIHSLAILHAAIAGIFLFLSGIIAGSVANRDKHRHVYYRIQEHPLLKKSFGRIRAKKLAKLYEKKWAGIISNWWFGVFMGSTASIGIFLGLDIDIRHITFASGNLALALYGANYNIATDLLVWGVVGIGVIGLVNFLVSFGLSMGLAFRSRNIPFSELGPISKAIWKHFKRKPGSFFFPSFRRTVVVEKQPEESNL